MAPKRRTAARQISGQQATLSFNGKSNRVTKNRQSEDAKTLKKDPDALVSAITDESQAEVKQELKEPTTLQKAIQQQTKEEVSTLPADPIEQKGDVRTSDVLGGKAEPDDKGAVGGKGAGWVSDEEVRARKTSEAAISKYWRAKESERIAPRIHQGDLTVHEKVLREWDMSNQYGPCIGVARLKRWKRANLLGLEPPIEVLAVLLKQLDQGDTNSQQAYVDKLMSSRFIET